MKTTKSIVIIVAALLIALPPVSTATSASGSLSVGAVTPLNSDGSACAGTGLTATVALSFNSAFAPDVESTYSYCTFTLSVNKGSITVSSDGTSGTWTWTPANSDDGSQTNTFKLSSITFYGTDLSGNPITWSAPDASNNVTLTIHATGGTPVQPPTPQAGPVSLAPPTQVVNQIYTSYSYPAIITHSLTGTINAITGNATYTSYRSTYDQVLCGQALIIGWVPAITSWSVGGSLGGANGSVSISWSYTIPTTSQNLYNATATPYKLWLGLEWKRHITPNNTTGSVTDSYTMSIPLPPPTGGVSTSGPYTQTYNGAITFANMTIDDIVVGTLGYVGCCPSYQ